MTHPDALFGRMGNRLFQMAYLFSQMKEGHTPDIYVQDYRRFDKYRDELQQWWGDGIRFTPAVSIHVRRAGNPKNTEEPRYAENRFYVNLLDDTDYYEQAMAQFPGSKFLVFSDAPEECKEYDIFNESNIEIVEGGTELEDFNHMAGCQSNIIANSSFSYWAAYLNPNKLKTVIAPSKWFSDGVERCVVPPEWIRI